MLWNRGVRHLLTAVVIAVISACAQSESDGAAQRPPMEVEQLAIETRNGPVSFTVEIADDVHEQARGLMFRESLADDRGMLFDFPDPVHADFWMHNTMISLDIIFIGPDGRILNIAARTTPYSQAPIRSQGLARGVLEIRGGRAEELGIQPGDRVRHRFFPD